MNVVTIDGIEMNIVLKEVKNINIRISEDGKVYVSANKHISRKCLIKYLESKINWIKNGIKKVNKFSEQKDYNKKIEIETGKIVVLFGDKYILNILNSSGREYGEIINKHINIYVNDNSYEKLEYILNSLIQQYSVIVIKKRFELIKEMLKENKIPDATLTLRKMKTRWGTCNVINGKITINTELVNFPIECLNYVIIHEFIHFFKREHDKIFYSYVEKIMPDYAKYMKILNKN